MHPPKTNPPTADVEQGNEICQSKAHRIRIVSRSASGGELNVRALYDLAEGHEYRSMLAGISVIAS